MKGLLRKVEGPGTQGCCSGSQGTSPRDPTGTSLLQEAPRDRPLFCPSGLHSFNTLGPNPEPDALLFYLIS